MFSRETIRVAMDALRANKVKAALTMLGVVIGSACIVLVVTIALIGKTYVMAQIEGVGSNLVYASYFSNSPVRPVADEISLGDLAAAKQLPHVVEAAGTHDMSSSVVINGQERAVTLIGVTEGFQKIRNLLILKGRFFDSVDMQTASKACMITQDLAKKLPDQNMVGNQIHIGELTFTVIAVFRERVATFGQSEITSESVLIPFPLIKYYSGKNYIRTLYVQADSADNVPVVTREVQRLLESRHRPGAVYLVQNLTSILDAARKISMALTAVLLLVGTIALIISGVGIMNIMLVTVTERTREIGLRKAVGARRQEILYQFLVEAMVISGVGALIGIAVALGIDIIAGALIPTDMNLHIPISVGSILAAFVVSLSTGMIFGWLPANRASKLQPTESLRYE
ncbi:MAG: ABC transporter permease [Terriglobia bacterium]|jgi:putative ABC transport system permease protein|nr:ABC transporter permease [Terriglobia bacterium]